MQIFSKKYDLFQSNTKQWHGMENQEQEQKPKAMDSGLLKP